MKMQVINMQTTPELSRATRRRQQTNRLAIGGQKRRASASEKQKVICILPPHNARHSLTKHKDQKKHLQNGNWKISIFTYLRVHIHYSLATISDQSRAWQGTFQQKGNKKFNALQSRLHKQTNKLYTQISMLNSRYFTMCHRWKLIGRQRQNKNRSNSSLMDWRAQNMANTIVISTQQIHWQKFFKILQKSGWRGPALGGGDRDHTENLTTARSRQRVLPPF